MNVLEDARDVVRNGYERVAKDGVVRERCITLGAHPVSNKILTVACAVALVGE